VAILQIRDLPDDLYAELRREAARSHRSIAQQAIVELRKAQALDTSGRQAALKRIVGASPAKRSATKRVPAPEKLIRADRSR
jgi:plasmid stability protein